MAINSTSDLPVTGSSPTHPVPPSDCHHYQTLGEVPWDVQKYWQQRYQIFSRYDDGILMTDDAWFGITPEPVAEQITAHITSRLAYPSKPFNASSPSSITILDLFSGAGGNTIAFAHSGHFDRIIGIEHNESVLFCARHNAQIYGVDEGIGRGKVNWVHGDAFNALEQMTVERRAKTESERQSEQLIVFASPPWGGQSYRSAAVFDLETMHPYSLTMLFTPLKSLTDDIALFLPRTSDLRQIAALHLGANEASGGQNGSKNGEKHKKIEVVHYCMYGASKGLCAYFGALAGTGETPFEASDVEGRMEENYGGADE